MSFFKKKKKILFFFKKKSKKDPKGMVKPNLNPPPNLKIPYSAKTTKA